MANGEITPDEYMTKLNSFVTRNVNAVKGARNQNMLRSMFDQAAVNYKKTGTTSSKNETAQKAKS